MRYAVVFTAEQRSALDSVLASGDGYEHAAYLLCGIGRGMDPWSDSGVCRLLVREVVAVDALVSNSAVHVTWGTDTYVALAARCERENLALFIAHNHPASFEWFSDQDDRNEAGLFAYAINKIGDDAVVGSLLLRADRSLIGRVWLDEPMRWKPIESVTTIGDKWTYEHMPADSVRRPHLHRQELALGSPLSDTLWRLRVGIVGCGATGSATAMMLARLGVGHLLLIDADTVDVTNLNRLHGATQSDADAGRKKADVLAREIAALGLGCKVRARDEFLEREAMRAEIKSCDVVFGCTDDNLGRGILSRFAYYYLTPVIDVGLAIRPREDRTGFTHIDGRVTLVYPRQPCMICREVIDADKMHADAMRRSNPAKYERQKAEGYITGGGLANPSVVTFTTQVAAMGVEELIQRLTLFRGPTASSQRNRDFLDPEDSTGGPRRRAGCRICDTPSVLGRGDCNPFLGMTV
jgi:hypothetical protein